MYLRNLQVTMIVTVACCNAKVILLYYEIYLIVYSKIFCIQSWVWSFHLDRKGLVTYIHVLGTFINDITDMAYMQYGCLLAVVYRCRLSRVFFNP